MKHAECIPMLRFQSNTLSRIRASWLYALQLPRGEWAEPKRLKCILTVRAVIACVIHQRFATPHKTKYSPARLESTEEKQTRNKIPPRLEHVTPLSKESKKESEKEKKTKEKPKGDTEQNLPPTCGPGLEQKERVRVEIAMMFTEQQEPQ